MLAKYYRRAYKPFHNKAFVKRIRKIRSEGSRSIDLDALVPDTRYSVETVDLQVKNIGIRILNVIKELAKENDFDFSLAYGTLLGAVRHKGFIPWDDDIDIFMTKSDFNAFMKLSYQLPNNLLLMPMDVGFFKVMDLSSIISFDGKRGVAVDIFIVSEKGENQLSFYNVHTLRHLVFEKEKYYPLQMLDFEKTQFNGPINYDYLLSRVYGDYMKLPPVEQRVSQHGDDSSIRINEYGKHLINPNDLS